MSKGEALSLERLIRAIFLSWSFRANGLLLLAEPRPFLLTPWAIFEVALIFMTLYYHCGLAMHS
jgi:hypothetical protein